MLKKSIFILVILAILCISVTFVACETAKQVVVDNREIIKQVLIEIIDQIIDMIANTPNASLSKSVIQISPDQTYLTVDIIDNNNELIKSVKYDILKRYKELGGF